MNRGEIWWARMPPPVGREARIALLKPAKLAALDDCLRFSLGLD